MAGRVTRKGAPKPTDAAKKSKASGKTKAKGKNSSSSSATSSSVAASAHIIQGTVESLAAVPDYAGPPLSVQYLRRPPFRYILDIVGEVRRRTGFTDGLFQESDVEASVLDKRRKMWYIDRLAVYVHAALPDHPRQIDASKVVAGIDPDKTNVFLQYLVQAATDSRVDRKHCLVLATASSPTPSTIAAPSTATVTPPPPSTTAPVAAPQASESAPAATNSPDPHTISDPTASLQAESNGLPGEPTSSSKAMASRPNPPIIQQSPGQQGIPTLLAQHGPPSRIPIMSYGPRQQLRRIGGSTYKHPALLAVHPLIKATEALCQRVRPIVADLERALQNHDHMQTDLAFWRNAVRRELRIHTAMHPSAIDATGPGFAN